TLCTDVFNCCHPNCTASPSFTPVAERSLVNKNIGMANRAYQPATNQKVARICSAFALSRPNGGLEASTNTNRAMTRHNSPPTYPNPQPHPDHRPIRSSEAISGSIAL